MLKDKLRPIKILRVYWKKNLFESGSAKAKAVRNTILTGARRKTFIEKKVKTKKGNYLIGYSLNVRLTWKSLVVIGCLRFWFLNLEAFIGLGFDLLHRLLRL